MSKQYRFFSPMQLRASTDSRRIEGRVFQYGTRSVLLPDWDYGRVFEEVTRGALAQDVIDASDIVCCLNHDQNQMLARHRDGGGSLELELDDEGLIMRFDAADTIWGNYAIESVRRGDFSGMSFGFMADSNTFSYSKESDADGKEYYVRHLDKIPQMFDVSIVTHPAYPATSVSARSADVREGLEHAGLLKAEPAPDSNPIVRNDFDTIGAWLRRTL